jgi:hypothetical protein
MQAGSSAAARAGAPPPPAAAGAGAGAALLVDPYEARVARLVASLPPEEVSADLRTMHSSFSFDRAGFARLDDPAAGVPELVQGVLDILRAATLEDAVLGERDIMVPPLTRDRLMGALGGGASSVPELALLRSLVLVGESYRLAGDAARLPPGEARAKERELLRAAEFWAAPGRAEATAARLAALDVERGGDAAADALLALAKAALNWAMAARGEVSVVLSETLARAIAAAPLGLTAASNLANALIYNDPRRAYQTALRALQRAHAAGLAFASVRLLIAAVDALRYGALGPVVRCGAIRPLIAGARRRLEAARRDVPRVVWLRLDERVRDQEANIAGVLDSAVVRSSNAGRPMLERKLSRACSRCDARVMEALLCSRCGAFYCSPACQKAHWPEHKAACKAATRRRGG